MSSESPNAFITEEGVDGRTANKSEIKFVVENASDDEDGNGNKLTKQPADDDDDDGSEQIQYDLRPISAVAPKVLHQDESQVEVSSTPAFQSLEELFQNGKLTGTQVAQLKAKYLELHETLKKSHDNEAKLQKQVKDSLKRLEEDKEILEKAEQFPDNLSNLSSEVLKLRAQYLKYNNDLSCFEEREYDYKYTIDGLEEEKKYFEREYARMPKAHELERRIQELELQNTELSKEIKQRNEDIKDLTQAIADKTKDTDAKAKDLKEALETVEMKKGEYVVINAVPNQIIKESDKLSLENDDLIKEKARIDAEYKQLYNLHSEIETQRQELDDKRNELINMLNKQKNVTFVKEKDYNDLYKQLEMEREKETVLLADKATLEISLRHSLGEKKGEYEAFLKAQKDKEREFKSCKKIELQLKTAIDSLANVKLAHEKVLAKKESMPVNDGSLFEERKDLSKEVDQLKKTLTQQQSLTAIEKVKVEKCIEEEEHLLCEQSDYRVEAVEVTRLAAIKADEREQKAREHMKAETRYKRAIEDLKTKDILIEDNRKKYRELRIKIREHAKMYDVIKNERNKCVNKIQICTQKAAEMREKIKILQNEIEILRTSLGQKEKRLQKQHLKFTNAIVLRDSIRNEVAKEKKIAEELTETQEQQKMNINNYNNLSVHNEQEAVKLRKRYDEGVKSRNERGIELITRTEEVCVICERVNVQETMLKNANIDLHAKEEEIRFLKLQSNEEKRQVGLLQKDLPNKEALDEELKALQTQLTQCQNRLIDLETQVQNSDNTDRVNFLEGKDESPEEVVKKLEVLENKLAIKEEQCLEKDLILEQVCRLTDRITNKVETSKEDTLSLAKNVNDIQSRIKDVTRKMMATVSELSIAQAQALTLQEDVKTKELELEQCYVRMEKGEAPSEELEREWVKMILHEEKVRQEKYQKQSQEEEIKQHLLPGGIITTAEPRPNAYMPQDDNELPIPRPYGKAAPFKPATNGSNMRHIKKPNPKPIEI